MLLRPILALPVLLGLGLLLLAPLATVSAHEHVDVGDLEFVVGWRVEPPVAGVLNGLDLEITRHSTGEPVLGAAGNLTATLSTGPASTVQSLRPQFGRDGWYTFDVFLTRDGSYDVRIEGTLEGTAVDFTVTLATVRSRADLEFPVIDPSASELQQTIADETAALRAQVSTLSIIAVLGVIVGGVGAAIASLAIWKMRPGP